MTDRLGSVKQIMSNLFNVEENTITLESTTKNLPAWDSMGQLMLILELEQQFDLQIPPERAEKLTSVALIVHFLDETGHKLVT